MSGARVIVADPPWLFGDKCPGKGRGAVKHYGCMPTRELCAYKLPPLDDECVLFLWRCAAMQLDAFEVGHAWGFRHHSELVWRKLTRGKRKPGEQPKEHFGMGHIVRGAHEVCLIFVRGKRTPKPKTRAIRSLFSAPVGVHSEKPEAFFELVERLYDGPRVELFARRTRPGWTQYGHEVGKLGVAPGVAANTNTFHLQVIA